MPIRFPRTSGHFGAALALLSALVFLVGLPTTSSAQAITQGEAKMALEDVLGATDAGGGWYRLDNRGTAYYFNISQLPYVYSETFGWIYLQGNLSGLYLYSFTGNVWAWTAEDVVPYIYVFGFGWIQAEDDTFDL